MQWLHSKKRCQHLDHDELETVPQCSHRYSTVVPIIQSGKSPSFVLVTCNDHALFGPFRCSLARKASPVRAVPISPLKPPAGGGASVLTVPRAVPVSCEEPVRTGGDEEAGGWEVQQPKRRGAVQQPVSWQTICNLPPLFRCIGASEVRCGRGLACSEQLCSGRSFGCRMSDSLRSAKMP